MSGPVILAMEPFRFGLPEAKAVALAVAIIGVWALIRYGFSRPDSSEPDPH